VSFSIANHERVFSGDSKVIPPFDQSGSLPPGVHRADIHEVEERFGRQSEIRRVQMESVRWMVELAKRAGAERIVLNGSFVTDIIEPNDVDCVLLTGKGFPTDKSAEEELRAGLPFLEIAMVGQRAFDGLVNVYFATDRQGTPKGMVELIL
jgi:hypothetical protein